MTTIENHYYFPSTKKINYWVTLTACYLELELYGLVHMPGRSRIGTTTM